MKAFVVSQFAYCPLTLTAFKFSWAANKSQISKLHQRNLQFLVTEIFKLDNMVSTGLTENIFQFANKPYNSRNNSMLLRKRNRTVFYGTRSRSSLAPKLKLNMGYQTMARLCESVCTSYWFHVSCTYELILSSFSISVFYILYEMALTYYCKIFNSSSILFFMMAAFYICRNVL